MQSVEITAKSVEEAKRTAAEKLGVSADQVQVTVLEETRGLFGKNNYRVRAEVASPKAAAKSVAPKAAEAAPEKAAPEKAPAEKAAPAARGRARTPKAKEAEAAPAPVAEVAAPAPVATEGEADKGRRRRGGTRRNEEAPAAAAAASGEAAEEGSEESIVATQADAEQLAALLRELLVSADLSVDVTPTGLNGRYVNLQFDGKDAAFLVGKHGEVLNALQYLLNIIGGRRFNNGVRATLDGNDYRRRREETLTQLASNIAEQVKKRGEEAVLDALPAFERRIVHKALSTISGISTYSEGEEPNRRVVIAPAE